MPLSERYITEEVYNPTAGLDYRIPDTEKSARLFTGMQNMSITDGVIYKEPGTSYYGFPDASPSALAAGQAFTCIEEFFRRNGDSHCLAYGSNYIYEYDDDQLVWQHISTGTLVCNCDDAWTASANVTATANTTIFRRGTASAKLAIAAGFTTGLAAYFNFAAKDVTASTKLVLWIYPTVSVTSGHLGIRLSEQNAGGTGATYATYNVGALTANQWNEVILALSSPTVSNGGSYPADLNAVLSVSLIVNTDFGAADIYLDDIRTITAYTGTQDDPWTTTTHNYKLYAANGVDVIQEKVDGADFTALAGSSGYIPNIVRSFQQRLCLFNTNEGGTLYPRRVRWSISTGLTSASSDWTGTTAGYVDLMGGDDAILAAEYLGTSTIVIYLERSRFTMQWVGGDSIWDFTSTIKGQDSGPLGPRCVCTDGVYHYILTKYGVYRYDGGNKDQEIGGPIRAELFRIINDEKAARSFAYYNPSTKEACFVIPTESDNPDKIFAYNVETGTWRGPTTRDIYSAGFCTSHDNLTWGELLGSWDGLTFRWDDRGISISAPNMLFGTADGFILKWDITIANVEDTVAQEAFFKTIPFSKLRSSSDDDMLSALIQKVQDKENQVPIFYTKNIKRFQRFVADLRGNLVTISYSTDLGSTWTTPSTWTNYTLTSAWTLYEFWLDVSAKTIMFKLENSTVDSSFDCRYYRVDALPEEELQTMFKKLLKMENKNGR